MNMRSAILVTLVTLFAGYAEAATIAVGRGFENPGVVAADTFLTGGAYRVMSEGGYYFAVGTFTNASGVTEVPVITDRVSLLAAVNSFDVFSALTSPTSGATQGTLTGSFSGLGGADPSVFNLKPIYFLVGNAPTLAASGNFGIFRITGSADFPANVQGASGPSLTLANGASITPLPNAGYVDGNYFVLGIPEPSGVLLGALGMLGLVRRRR